MNDSERAIRYLFILGVLLILVAYYAGAVKLGGTLFSGVNTLGLTFTGRNAQGNFASYAGGGPSTATTSYAQL